MSNEYPFDRRFAPHYGNSLFESFFMDAIYGHNHNATHETYVNHVRCLCIPRGRPKNSTISPFRKSEKALFFLRPPFRLTCFPTVFLKKFYSTNNILQKKHRLLLMLQMLAFSLQMLAYMLQMLAQILYMLAHSLQMLATIGVISMRMLIGITIV